MGIETATRIKCDRCQKFVTREGGNQLIPDDWRIIKIFDNQAGEVGMMVSGNQLIPDDWRIIKIFNNQAGEVGVMVVCDKCCKVIKSLDRKPRKDKGIPKTKKGQPSPVQPSGRPRKVKSAPFITPTTLTPQKGKEQRLARGLSCAGCPEEDQKGCVLVDTASLDCYAGRFQK